MLFLGLDRQEKTLQKLYLLKAMPVERSELPQKEFKIY